MTGEHILSDQDLRQHLDEQIAFLQRSAEAFDQGFDGEAKRLAVVLRVLLHQTPRSHALLKQLGMDGILFVDTASPEVPGNHCTTHGLIGLHIGDDVTRYVPLLDGTSTVRHVPFLDWWEAIVFVDQAGNRMSRRELVLAATNKDGGAHVDPLLTGGYAAISRNHSLGWMARARGSNIDEPVKGAERVALRQVAHEVLKTLVPGYEKAFPDHDGTVVSGLSVVKVADADPASGDKMLARAREPEISGGKFRFFPEAGDYFFKNSAAGKTKPEVEYRVEIDIDSVTVGHVRAIVGGRASDPLSEPGQHRFVMRAGDDQDLGIFGASTDAVVDRVSVREIL